MSSRPFSLCFCLLSLTLAAIPTYAQDSTVSGKIAPPTAQALRIQQDTHPAIDGALSEALWRRAPTITGFTQRGPSPGESASRETEVRLLYGDAALYVGARLYDHPDSVAARLFRRDEDGYSDWFGIGIDGYDDDRTAFTFAINPKGVQRDVLYYSDDRSDTSWDAVWSADARIDSLGWTAEMRIPFSQLRFAEEKGDQTWGLNLWREIARRGETAFWSPVLPDESGYVSRFGQLRGLHNLIPPRDLELEPYVSSRLVRAPGDEDNPFYEPNAFRASVGGDLNYGLTPDLQLTATINPDFGQVEVDPAVINLSAFETFFPEKRPFFIEGMDAFQFGQPRTNVLVNSPFLFYSRRIGQAPHRRLRGYPYVDAPEQTTIGGAAKLSGNVGEHWSVGLLDAVTMPEDARYVKGSGEDEVLTAQVEPLTNYAVGRAERNFVSGQGFAGGFLTTVHRSLADSVLQDLLHEQAYVGGADFEYSWADQNWIVSGYGALSHVRGSAEALAATQKSSARYFARPDADYLSFDPGRTQLTGHTLQLALQKAGGGRWRSSLWYMQTSPGFEVNDLGFQSRADYRVVSPYLAYQVNEPDRFFRNYGVYGFGYSAWNFGGTHVGADIQLNAYGTLKNFWSLSGGVGASPWTMNDRLTRGGPLARSPASVYASLEVGTDSRKDLSFNTSANLRQYAEGGWSHRLSGSVEWRPTPALQLTAGPELSRSYDVAQYTRAVPDPLAEATFGTRYVFASLDQTTLSVPIRLNWTFSTDLSLQLFAQPFVSAGDYSGFKEFAAPGTFDFARYGSERGQIERTEKGRYRVDPDGPGLAAEAFTFRDPDFNYRSLRGNAVLRWEYRPGSTLYFVWQQQRSGTAPVGDFGFERDYGALLQAPAENVFVVKLTYWLGT